jgi:hypothetical protein
VDGTSYDDPWPDTAAPPDWSAEARVQFDPADPAKTIPLSWAQDYIQREYTRNRAQFGNRLAVVVNAWSVRGYGQNGSDGKGQ